jgi:hypothetical protein
MDLLDLLVALVIPVVLVISDMRAVLVISDMRAVWDIPEVPAILAILVAQAHKLDSQAVLGSLAILVAQAHKLDSQAVLGSLGTQDHKVYKEPLAVIPDLWDMPAV